MQDLLAIPLLADFASLRDELSRLDVAPQHVNPALPVDLVIDHSMTVFYNASSKARVLNEKIELEINAERFSFLKWCEQAFPNLKIIPPGAGIVHQINLEKLATCVCTSSLQGSNQTFLHPEFVIGTDSHTTMINGMSVLGWGVGGLEAEAVMLGSPLEILVPKVTGIRLTGSIPPGSLATDLALCVTEKLRAIGVVDQFVEFFGPGVSSLTIPDRATVANMAPEYGATCAFFAGDERLFQYLAQTGRSGQIIEQARQTFHSLKLNNNNSSSLALEYDTVLDMDLSCIAPSVAGPSRPQDRHAIKDIPKVFSALQKSKRSVHIAGSNEQLSDGDIVIASITSCTNTANPRAMLSAGLLARKANALGLRPHTFTKTSLAPGSRSVARYLKTTGLQDDLDALGFHVVGFACTTCNGMSGPLEPHIENAVQSGELTCAAVLSGNRNFPGRIHPHAKANFITSPPLVIAYALAGSVYIDISSDPIGKTSDGRAVFLDEIRPSEVEIDQVLYQVNQNLFPDKKRISNMPSETNLGSPGWQALPSPKGPYFDWTPASTYLKPSPYFAQHHRREGNSRSAKLKDLRPIVILGDDITTDHISPSGSIPRESAAGDYLTDLGVAERDLNAYGTRRANHDIVVRSFFANPSLQNRLAGGETGSLTKLIPDGTIMSIFDAVQEYRQRKETLVIIAGSRYGGGSSRDTAAKAPYLAGVRAVIAKSFERIHRSNLVNMGIWPLIMVGGSTKSPLLSVDLHRLTIEDLPTDFLPEMYAKISAFASGKQNCVLKLQIDIRTQSEFSILQSGGLLTGKLRDLSADYIRKIS